MKGKYRVVMLLFTEYKSFFMETRRMRKHIGNSAAASVESLEVSSWFFRVSRTHQTILRMQAEVSQSPGEALVKLW